jgi:hypothetical protein
MATRRLEALGLDRPLALRLIEALADGQYQLLLGAGVSLGANGGDGEPLQLAKATARDLVDAVGLTALEPHERDDLAFAYEEAKAYDSETLRLHLRQRFAGCRPSWQKLLFQFHWQRIWTLNVDDVLENAFKVDEVDGRYGELSSLSWKDPFRPQSLANRELQLVHLHGVAQRLRLDREAVVFSLPEYSELVRALPPWHAAFQTAYVQSPFIVCGARFTDEPDFVVATRISNQSERAFGIPSLVVSPSFTKAQAVKLRRFGLTPIAQEGEPFFRALLADLRDFEAGRSKVLSHFRPGVLERFASQFRRLTPERLSGPSLSTDFYSGDQPAWEDILAERDVVFATTGAIGRLLSDAGPKCFVATLVGALGTGKSSALLRLGRIALGSGLQPFLFRNEETLDVQTTLAFLSANPRAVLLFDDGADYSSTIGRLASAAKAEGVACRLIVTERERRRRAFRLDVADEFRREFELRKLSDSDIRALVRRRREASRLGRYIRAGDGELSYLMKTDWHRELLECLSQIEFGQGFRERVVRYVEAEFAAGASRLFVGAIACVHRFGLLLPLRIALSYFSEIDGFQRVLMDGDTSEGLVVRDSWGVRLRHRVVSEYVWRSVLSPEERYAAILRLAEQLSPLINPNTISAKSIAHRITREMLDHEVLNADIGIETGRLYSELEPQFDWSSRFWDQRALFEYRAGRFSQAYSFSQKAVSLERHAFAFTTLGTICMKEAVRILRSEPIRAKELYFEGVEALESGRRSAERQELVFEHPFVTFFSQTARFIRAMPFSDVDFAVLAEYWETWYRSAQDSPVFRLEYGNQRLADIRGTWLKLQLARRRGQIHPDKEEKPSSKRLESGGTANEGKKKSGAGEGDETRQRQSAAVAKARVRKKPIGLFGMPRKGGRQG